MSETEKDHSSSARTLHSAMSLTLRDFVGTAFRHQRLMVLCLTGALVVGLLAAICLPTYKGETKFLVVRERVDPVVTPSAQKDNLSVTNQPMVSEEELNSEIELLNSHDLLQKVVLACGLQKKGWWGWWRSPDQKIEAAVRRLSKDLDMDPVKRTNVILVTYKSRDSELVARVLSTLSQLYLEKHLAVHKVPGQFTFFERETERYRKGLEQAELHLADFPKQYGVVAPSLDRDITLQKLNEFNASLQQTRASIAELHNRIRKLEQMEVVTPARMTTQLRRSDNPQLLQQMKSTLLGLELKHSELLNKYQPDYRPVQEVEHEINLTRTAITAEEEAPVKDETTDVDPVHAWVRTELAKDTAELHGLQAREAATAATIRAYQATARDLDQKSLVIGDLQRTAKAEESNYLLYLSKREDARITEALDETRILNVAVAEQPTVPALPAHSALLFGLMGCMGMVALTAGLVCLLYYTDSTVRSPRDVELYLKTPVLAGIPYPLGKVEANGGRVYHC